MRKPLRSSVPATSSATIPPADPFQGAAVTLLPRVALESWGTRTTWKACRPARRGGSRGRVCVLRTGRELKGAADRAHAVGGDRELVGAGRSPVGGPARRLTGNPVAIGIGIGGVQVGGLHLDDQKLVAGGDRCRRADAGTEIERRRPGRNRRGDAGKVGVHGPAERWLRPVRTGAGAEARSGARRRHVDGNGEAYDHAQGDDEPGAERSTVDDALYGHDAARDLTCRDGGADVTVGRTIRRLTAGPTIAELRRQGARRRGVCSTSIGIAAEATTPGGGTSRRGARTP